MRAALLVALLWASPLVGQANAPAPRGRYWRPAPEAVVAPRWVFCNATVEAGWYAWVEIEHARNHDTKAWADLLRRHVASGMCLISGGGEALRAIGEAECRNGRCGDPERDGVFALVVRSPDNFQWYISPYAFVP